MVGFTGREINALVSTASAGMLGSDSFVLVFQRRGSDDVEVITCGRVSGDYVEAIALAHQAIKQELDVRSARALQEVLERVALL